MRKETIEVRDCQYCHFLEESDEETSYGEYSMCKIGNGYMSERMVDGFMFLACPLSYQEITIKLRRE